MFTSAELIEALRRRQRWSLRPQHPAGEFPPGWRAWFAALRERMGTISGATADAIVALMLQRELRQVPRRLPKLSDWQAFTTLWRQQWHPASRDERGQRIAAMTVSALAQFFIAFFLLWVGYARYGGEPMQDLGDDVVQVEFIGEGTPEEQGGGAAAGPEPEPAVASEPASAAPAAAPSPPETRLAEARPAPPATPAEPSPEPRPEPQPAPPAPPEPTSQPVQVTEAPPVEDAPFVLPPPTPRTVAVPRVEVRVPQLAQQAREIEVVETPTVRARPRDTPVREVQLEVPELAAEVQALPAPAPPLPDATARRIEMPQAAIRVPGLATEPGALPAMAGTGAEDGRDDGEGTDAGNTTAATGAGEQGAGTEDGNAVADGGTALAGSGGGQATGTNPGAGADPVAPAGALPTTRAGDDWGLSDRYRPGGQAGTGLFDETGRPRLPPGVKPEAGGGLPPGTVTADIQDLDREGTWLKRPPIGYEPTRFDRYWLPGGTLLEEWVRRGIREVSIAIPGTGKKIHCVVSLLALGGACGVDDPDMQDQEAEARPPPDIPWKPALQENQDAL